MKPLNDEQRALVEKHIKFVGYVINKYLPSLSWDDDIFQVGCIGLMRAAQSFDPSRGFKFSSFASDVIIREITHHRRYMKAKKRQAEFIDNVINLDGEEVSIFDRVVSNKSTDTQAIAKVDLCSGLSKLKPILKQVALYYGSGLRQEEIAAITKRSQPCICRYLAEIRQVLSEQGVTA